MTDEHKLTPDVTPSEGDYTPRETPEQARRAAAMSTRLSEAIPGYEIFGEAGHGGMGVVYKARQAKLNRTVALKMVLGEARADEKAVIRFLAEAEAVAAVRHPSVVQVYDYGEHDGCPYMALEFCPGGTLADRLRGKPLDPGAAARLVAAVAAGVGAAHEAGIVHRDIKPGNVLFDEHGEPKVADFGLAKRGAAELTRTGTVLGTPAYMSPEQAGAGTGFVGPQADVWALGVILYECLTGQRPFQAPDVDNLLVFIRTDAPPPPRKLVPRVPRDLETICLKCLEKDPADRYPSAKELADDLHRFLDGKPVRARPIGLIPRATRWARHNPVVAGLLAAVVLVSLGLVGSLASQYRQAIERATFEEGKKKEAEKLAAEKAALADAEAARRKEADEVTDFLAGMFRSSDPTDIFKDFIPANYAELRKRTAPEFLKLAENQFREKFRDQPVARARLLLALGNSHRSLGNFAVADQHLREALQLRQGLPLSPDHHDVVEVEFALGQLSLDRGDFFDAEARFRRVLEAQTQTGADERTRSLTRGFLAWSLAMLERPEAEQLLRDEIKLRELHFGAMDHHTVLVRIGLIAVLLTRGQAAEAGREIPAVMAWLEAQPSNQLRSLARFFAQAQVGIALRIQANEAPLGREWALKRAAAAIESSLEQAHKDLPERNIFVALVRFELGMVYVSLGDQKRAAAEFQTCLETVRATCGLAHPKVIVLLQEYPRLLAQTGKADEARKLFDEVLAENTKQFGEDNHWRTNLLLERAIFEATVGGRPDLAAWHTRDALTLAVKGKLLPIRLTGQELVQLTGVFPWGSHLKDAHDLFTTARPVVAATYGDHSSQFCLFLLRHYRILAHQGKWADAQVCLREAEAANARARDPTRAFELSLFAGDFEAAYGRFAAAEVRYREATDLARPGQRIPENLRQTGLLRLAGALAEQGKYRPAADAAEQVYRGMGAEVLPHGLAFALARVVILRSADGDRDGAAAALKELTDRFGRSDDTIVLTILTEAWALAPADIPGWDHAGAAHRLTAALRQQPANLWPQLALALAHLRTNDSAAAAAVLTRAGNVVVEPRQPLLLGLAVARAGNPNLARVHLVHSDVMTVAFNPSETKPSLFVIDNWFPRLLNRLLRAELEGELNDRLAPPPRTKS
jgi:tetratricopeptide (TPR) repeat protein/tRNA A-37 threonylcarbamoyl transferase component Bud32